ncbi:MAG: ABC transporter ATP-binding protein, partial [Rhodothermia bacterium]|nr:ABC transporter ATP-binding protein [Rhodothermia bacterium]
FIDTPVKRYSSGMRVRLAFSVAAHLDPEILLVDEVLAVGDVAFQKKCLGKMDSVAKGGRTVVFVSHNMSMVQSLCQRGVLMQDGSVVFDGAVEDTIGEYMKSAKVTAEASLEARTDREGGEEFRFSSVEFLDPTTASKLDVIVSGQPVLIKIGYTVSSQSNFDQFKAIITFYNAAGSYMFACSNEFVGKKVNIEDSGGATYCYVPKWPLDRGEFHYELFASNGKGNRLDFIKEAGFVDVRLGDYYRKGIVKTVVKQQGMFIDFDWFDEDEVAVVQ